MSISGLANPIRPELPGLPSKAGGRLRISTVASTLTLAPRQTRRIQKIEWERRERARRSFCSRLAGLCAATSRRPPLIVALAGLAVAMVGAWLGGELVDRLGVGVDRGADLNVPSSLTGGPGSTS